MCGDERAGVFVASGTCAMLGFWLVWPFETLKNQLQAGTQIPVEQRRNPAQYVTLPSCASSCEISHNLPPIV